MTVVKALRTFVLLPSGISFVSDTCGICQASIAVVHPHECMCARLFWPSRARPISAIPCCDTLCTLPLDSITRASFKCKVVHWSGARFPTEYGLDMDTSWLHLTCRHGVCDVSVITLEHISPRLPRLGWSTSSGNASHASVLMALCSLFSSFVWPVQCLHSACTVPATVPAWRNPNEMQNRVRVKRISSN